MKRIRRVIPRSTSTNEMLIVEVIFAFKKRTEDIFFIPDFLLPAIGIVSLFPNEPAK
jgi:hypothetical protein